MSIRVMSAVYESDLDDIYDVSVMLALANHADDNGVCYPSIARICKLSRCKVRKAQNVIKSLQDRGYLSIEMQAGPKGTNRYHLTPAPHAPRTTRRDPRMTRHLPPHSVHPKRQEPSKNRHYLVATMIHLQKNLGCPRIGFPMRK